jgi:archaellum component FlaF (FlaF/FlaG flagellin family)
MKHKIKSITKGTVQRQRSGESVFQTVSAGTVLLDGERLKTSPDAVVTLTCGDATEPTVPKGTETPVLRLCPERQKKGGTNPQIPFIISPLDTQILTDKPTLRWNRATSANSFTVTLHNGELEWTLEVKREQVCQGNVCELIYPEDKPGLQPGVSYTLVVKADTNRESTEDISPGFTTLSKEEAEEVRAIAKQIEAEDLPPIEKKIKLAEYYADHNLIAEAIEILEGLPKAEKSIAVYLRIGVLYSSIGLIRKAEVAYEEAIKLPQATENTQELAAVKMGLGEVKFDLNDTQKAVSLLEEAKAEYEKLEDAQRVEELKERIAEILAM